MGDKVVSITDKHVWIIGDRVADRRLAAVSLPATNVSVSCHRLLRGPFTGASSLLIELVPHIYQRWPNLLWAHRFAILTVAPQLEKIIGVVPKNLTLSSTGEERTRYQGGLARRASHGVVELLVSYSRERDNGPLIVAFDAIHAADFTDQEFLAILVRRADPRLIQLHLGSNEEPLPEGLAKALGTYAGQMHAPIAEPLAPRRDELLLQAFVESGGTSDDPHEISAWQRADPRQRAALHDAAADELARHGDLGHRLGAIPYHREHGSDPTNAGVEALEFAVNHCIGHGLYQAARELADRACAIVDPDRQQREYCLFRAKIALSASPLEPKLAETTLNELRRRYALPKVHMSTSYSIAMLYTKFHAKERIDHDLAKAYTQNAIAIATTTDDPQDRAFYTAFHQNGLALVEMHRGDLRESLRLVTSSIELLERELPEDKHRLHHSVLFHNRARLHQALGMLDEAKWDFDSAISLDPNFSEYYYDRGSLARLRGDDAAAVADYEKAMSLSAPYPETYYSRGDVRAVNGDISGALTDFDYVLELEPDHLDARINRAALRLESGDLDGALADVEHGLTLHPGNAHLLCTQGLIAMETGNYPCARASFQEALEADATMYGALVNSAVLDYNERNYNVAVHKLTRALVQSGNNPDLLYNRGLAHHAAGQHNAAIEDYTTALTLPGADRTELLHQRSLCYSALRQAAKVQCNLAKHQPSGA
jgi:tetratricopeptide (TPR) repeat protein